VDYPYILPDKIIFKKPSPLNEGQFSLMKPVFIIDGYNVPRSGRCDNLTYSGELVSYGTKYVDEGIHIGRYSPYLKKTIGLDNIAGYEYFFDASPYFCILYIKWATPGLDGRMIHSPEIQDGKYPGALWGALSMAELFKNMREWSFMVEQPFNSDHPMAIYSKMVFDTLAPPQEILDEIDAMPDMHLARFLKGDKNHRDYVDGFPQMSEKMIHWFKTKLKQFPRKTTAQYLDEVII